MAKSTSRWKSVPVKKKAGAKKAVTKKAPVKKSRGKKAAAKKSPAKKVVKKKAPGKKAPAKKAATKKAIARIAAVTDTSRDVKVIIITNSPLSGLKPEDLTDDMKLVENLSYSPNNIVLLTIDLDKYVNDRDSSKHITSADMKNAKTVGDDIKLVKTKLNET